jgi:hypothetical protein
MPQQFHSSPQQLIRAVNKAAAIWIPERFHTGSADEDAEVSEIARELISAAPRCAPGFVIAAAQTNDFLHPQKLPKHI